jgi:hypothetical protein
MINVKLGWAILWPARQAAGVKLVKSLPRQGDDRFVAAEYRVPLRFGASGNGPAAESGGATNIALALDWR